MYPVHPRVCGEHSLRCFFASDRTGSSPRLRGTYPPVMCLSGRVRFIPASAGNIHAGKHATDIEPVHPRVCGEHMFAQISRAEENGSSPRLRGTFTLENTPRISNRFIPASAGNISTTTLFCLPLRGSSPRLRGTYGQHKDHPHRVRFIPASAGNIHGYRSTAPAPTVHPRVCGEHTYDQAWIVSGDGSSPRLRGTSIPARRGGGLQRFIPASAGNISRYGDKDRMRAVHPRVCGEHLPTSAPWTKRTGSSPRLRGTYDHAVANVPGMRFIPASAGNIASANSRTRPRTVHPRVCGEHCGSRRFFLLSGGSSPRLRGTFRCDADQPGRRRFIPASAGNMRTCQNGTVEVSVHPRVCGEHTTGSSKSTTWIGSSPRLRGTLDLESGIA